jgi:hypothetical protein
MWIFTHGIACLQVTGVSRMTEDDAAVLMSDVFAAMIKKIKGGGTDEKTI